MIVCKLPCPKDCNYIPGSNDIFTLPVSKWMFILLAQMNLFSSIFVLLTSRLHIYCLTAVLYLTGSADHVNGSLAHFAPRAQLISPCFLFFCLFLSGSNDLDWITLAALAVICILWPCLLLHGSSGHVLCLQDVTVLAGRFSPLLIPEESLICILLVFTLSVPVLDITVTVTNSDRVMLLRLC